MENEAEMLEKLKRHDPKVFHAVYDLYIHDMIEQASQSLHNYVAGNEIVTRIWWSIMKDDYVTVELPFQKFFYDQVKQACEITKIVGII